MFRISAVIPTKDRKEMCLRAVRSALAQSFPPVEIIVVDDASTDGTADAVRAIGDSRVRVLPSTGSGPAHARNTGLTAAEGDLFAFLDSDDEWITDKLERQVRLFESANPPLLIFSDALIDPVPHDGRRTVFSRQPPSNGDIFRPLLLDNFIPTSSVIVPRKAVMDAGILFNPKFSPAEDYDFWLKTSRQGKCTFDPRPLSVYHLHAGQISRDLAIMHEACIEVISENAFSVGRGLHEKSEISSRLRTLRHAAENERMRFIG